MIARHLAAAALVLLAAAGTAQAAVTFKIEGVFSGGGPFAAGDPFSLKITYDATAPGLPPTEAGTLYFDAITSFAFTGGPVSFTSAETSWETRIGIIHGANALIQFVMTDAAPLGEPGPIDGLNIIFGGHGPSLPSDALPADRRALFHAFASLGGPPFASAFLGSVTYPATVTAVTPIPAALPLLGSALALVGLLRRRRH